VNESLHWLDVLVIVLYFAVIIGYGIWVTRRVKSSDGYFVGERKFGWWIMIAQAFGTGTHAENFVAQTGASFQAGFSTIWYQWKNMLITPFYWLIAPWYRRSERTTVGEIVEDRYGRGMGTFYSIFAILFFVVAQGTLLKGAGKVISVASGEMISVDWIVVVMTLAVVVYTFWGGLVATAYANLIQAMMIIILSFMLIPFGLNAVNGFSGMRALLPDDFFQLFSERLDIGLFTVSMLALNGLVGITAQPHMISMCATGKTERAGRVGQTYGSLVKRLVTIGWALTGMIVAALVIQTDQQLNDPEMAFGYACRALLGPGLVGLMIASVLSANMSAASNFMVNNGALFTCNVYQRLTDRTLSDKRLLWVGRCSGFGLTILGGAFALYIGNVLQAFLFMETTAAFMGIMMFGGMLWKRANRYGAVSGVAVAFVLYYYLNYLDTGRLDLVYIWTPGIFGWAMLAGFLFFIIVSLFTRKEDVSRTQAFFDKMQRLSDAETSPDDGKKPLASKFGKDLMLVDLPGWFTRARWIDFLKRYREDWFGFILATCFVGFLILIAWGIIQL